MKKIFITATYLFMLQLFFMPSAFPQKQKGYESHLQAGQSPKDGEEFINRMQYDDKSKLLFYISNDEQNLYIWLISADRANIQKIMRYGLTTWLDPDGKQKKGLGVQFPVPADELSGPPAFKEGGKPGGGNDGRGQGGDRKEMMNRMMANKNNEMVLIGFTGKGQRDTIQLKSVPEFSGKIEMLDGGKILVSLMVPLAKIESRGKAGDDRLLSVGFETGYMDLNQSGIAATGGSQQGSGGGGYGGGMYGGPPPGSGGQPSGSSGADSKSSQQQASISELANPTKLWIRPIKLAGR